MDSPFLGTEALRSGALTRAQLRWNYRAILPNVYVHKDARASLWMRTKAAWLWSGRRAIIAGRAAAALHGALWIDSDIPIELLWHCPRPPPGIIARNERFSFDEIVRVRGLYVTSPTRTALDLARHLTRDPAVAHLDALARATGIESESVLDLAELYPGARGVAQARDVAPLLDAGAQSPRESWLRLVLTDAGFPRPRTQIPVTDGFSTAYLDMGWDDEMIGCDYDGEKHFSDRSRFVHDIGRNELVAGQGWIVRHVVAEHSRKFIVRRVNEAFRLRGIALRGTVRPDCA
ncbi:hypothetical protein [Mycolicibacterium confluentis]|uniref:Uncharacterized protein n=1 Tax=Mycolicibacterium confluentis TaxID=28047 RepID=A0A7I7XS41_9MYCO|nr:hypothetical protein [Mycolicibacterium confluentis]MCV7318822.1 hypothetical protein [Mycolicibacterium confluentis]ORV23066.1 hypothetical protein AWB99_24400 [Mycolicibacterium confluentis]BBZ31974.1 hypothetical protein MCNF_05790 [Mycolicibacterium confluentis]